ncbi:hypothetical protein PI124_g8806 [Phytophthora idaei]|nr:hypothetical protein PI125_g16703 [Phytophthora idaei]KAG3141236.1 hypothetical protein PI126_g15586 [Phytophthora idaei]KAG3246485.1 hypothetical protein PI124_g8806 [Phytophthora idaei]
MSANSSGGQQPRRGQTQAQQGTGQQQQNHQQPAMAGVAGGGAFPRRMFGSKPPKYTEGGGFDLYRAQIEGVLDPAWLLGRGGW